MNTNMITVELTEREAKAISTLIGHLNGRLQYKIIVSDEHELGANRAFVFWNRISEKIAKSMGVHWCVLSKTVDHLITDI